MSAIFPTSTDEEYGNLSHILDLKRRLFNHLKADGPGQGVPIKLSIDDVLLLGDLLDELNVC